MKGQVTAFQADVIALRPLLLWVARRLSRSDTLAEDLVQEAILKALRCEHQFAPGTNLKGWVTTILRNVYLSGARSAQLRVYADLPEEPQVEGPGAADVLTRVREMREALGLLPAHQRSAVLLAAEGYSYDEIAAIEGCNLGTAKSRVSRARHALRDMLGEAA